MSDETVRAVEDDLDEMLGICQVAEWEVATDWRDFQAVRHRLRKNIDQLIAAHDEAVSRRSSLESQSS